MLASADLAGRPLAGRRIVITRAQDQSEELAKHLRSLGAEPIICPAIQIDPPDSFDRLDAAIDRLAEFDWIVFTSGNGVTALLDRMARRSRTLPASPPNVAVVGAATARVAEAHGLPVTAIPERYVAESLVETFGDLTGQSVLLVRADIARPTLRDGLRGRGAVVEDVVAYRTVPGHGIAQLGETLRAGGVDAVTFSSSSTVRYFLEGLRSGPHAEFLRDASPRPAIICLGPVTASAARASGLPVDAVASTFDAEGLTEALIDWFSRPRDANA